MALELIKVAKVWPPTFLGSRKAPIAVLALYPLLWSSVLPAQPASASMTVVLRSFRFEPARIELRSGVPVMVRLENLSSGGHSFVAPAFFASSRIEPASGRLIENGRVEVPAHQTVELRLTPTAGNYPLKCGHMLHAVFGMTGTILVR